MPTLEKNTENRKFNKKIARKRMTIDEIYKKGNLSIRSYHVCKYNDIQTIFDLKKYFKKHKSFIKLKNCGRKSDEELIRLSNSYYPEGKDSLDNNIQEKKIENPLKKTISELTRVQREVINSFILVNTNSLSVRSKNAVTFHLKKNFKIKNFAEKVFFNSVDIKHWKNVGAKSIPEIELYLNIIKDFVKEVSESKEEKHLISLKNNFLIQHTFSTSKIPSEILETESIFLLTDFLLNQNFLFNENQTNIVKTALKIYKNQKELTLDDIAEKVNLTRERVRQIRVTSLEGLFNKLLFIKNFNDDLLQKYNIDINANQIEIDSELINLINIKNLTNLSQEFITYILYAYLSNDFSLIGNIEDVMLPTYFNARKRHNWNNFFLIKNELVIEMDFDALVNNIDCRLNDRIEESYSFNFKSYLSKFLTTNKIEILDLVFPIAEKIVNDEFELYLDLDENITFKRNTVKQAYEYSYEALEQLGKPSKVKEIFEKIIELNPNYETDEDKVRSSLKRTNGFVPIGRKSVFGLKKWESELDNFKGGTIKDVIIDFLQNKTEPIHISYVLEYLEKFRKNKDAKSVLTNLKVDPKKRFIVYNQGFIGLKTNKNTYSNKYENLPVQLGKTIISKHKKGHSINAIQTFLKKTYELNFDESILIINYLKYFNEN